MAQARDQLRRPDNYYSEDEVTYQLPIIKGLSTKNKALPRIKGVLNKILADLEKDSEGKPFWETKPYLGPLHRAIIKALEPSVHNPVDPTVSGDDKPDDKPVDKPGKDDDKDDSPPAGDQKAAEYKYDAMVKPVPPAKVEIEDVPLQPANGDEVQKKFDDLANKFSEGITNLADAFKNQNKDLTDAVGDKLASIHKNVKEAVGKVQTEAHDKREEIISHVNAQGVKVEEAINALQNGGTKLDDKRKEDEEKRKSDLEEAKKEQDKKDKKVDVKLSKHDVDIERNTQNIAEHEGKLTAHEDKHEKARYQRELVKKAMDSDCGGGYGTKELMGTARDKLKNWDEGKPRQRFSSRRRLPANYASMRPSEQALTRRRLMNRPNSHVVVLEQLLGEINRLNATN